MVAPGSARTRAMVRRIRQSPALRRAAARSDSAASRQAVNRSITAIIRPDSN